MFKSTFGKGFHLVFDNGIALSTQFGYGNYCANNMRRDIINGGILSCEDAEIAIISKDGGWLTRNCLIDLGIKADDDVLGRVDMETWLKILDWCRKQEA